MVFLSCCSFTITNIMIIIIIFFDIIDHYVTFKLSPKHLLYEILYFTS